MCLLMLNYESTVVSLSHTLCLYSPWASQLPSLEGVLWRSPCGGGQKPDSDYVSKVVRCLPTHVHTQADPSDGTSGQASALIATSWKTLSPLAHDRIPTCKHSDVIKALNTKRGERQRGVGRKKGTRKGIWLKSRKMLTNCSTLVS